jgi:drug/metabolite transporter (DMT)-like permease
MKNPVKSWLILIFLSLVWGSSFILMKRGMLAFSSREVAALRIAIAFLVLLPFFFKYYKIDWKKYFSGLFLMGVFGNLIPAFLFTAAETQISSSLAGMLNALTPLFAIIVGAIWLKNKPGVKQITGIVFGFIAASCLLVFDSSANVFKNVSYGFLVVLATICYAVSVNSIKKYLGGLGSVQATVLAFSITGPMALVYLFAATPLVDHLTHHPMALSSLAYVCILAVVGTALSVILYNTLIKSAGVIFASSCTYLIPVVAILWGVFDGERVNFTQILSILAIIWSVYLINRD